MHCENIQRQLDDYLDGGLSPSEQAAIAEHLQHCSGCCQAFSQTQQLLLALQAMPVTPPQAGYAQRVLGFLHDPRTKPVTYTPRPLWFATGFATAMLALFTVWFMFATPARLPAQGVPAITLHVLPDQVRKVDLVFNSPVRIEHATLRLELPAGIELNGYARRRVLQWQTELKPGANRLTLPLQATNAGGGVLTARISHNGKSHTYKINIVTYGASSQRHLTDLTV